MDHKGMVALETERLILRNFTMDDVTDAYNNWLSDPDVAMYMQWGAKSGATDGIAVVFCTHTTAGITINENADPDVIHDLLIGLDKTFPDHMGFRYGEGNSSAYLKASAMGSSTTVIIENGRLLLGTWQGIYFTEFDPPRNRKFFVKVVGV